MKEESSLDSGVVVPLRAGAIHAVELAFEVTYPGAKP